MYTSDTLGSGLLLLSAERCSPFLSAFGQKTSKSIQLPEEKISASGLGGLYLEKTGKSKAPKGSYGSWKHLKK